MLGQPYRPPQVDATDYLGAQARGALAQTRNSAAQPRTPSLTGQPVHTSSARSPWLLRRPAPAPRREPSGTGCPARGCCVGRARPSCARKHASAARKLLEKPRGGRLGQSPGVGGKGGRWRGWEMLLQGLPGDGGGAGYIGPAPGRHHSQLGLGRQQPAPSRHDTLANKQATRLQVPLSLFYKQAR